jgi:hypothetical protein
VGDERVLDMAGPQANGPPVLRAYVVDVIILDGVIFRDLAEICGMGQMVISQH